MPAGPPDDSFDPVTDMELNDLRALVARAGEATAVPIITAVSGIEALGDLRRVTRREWATLRIALTVATAVGGVG
jgi:hypothetical protein